MIKNKFFAATIVLGVSLVSHVAFAACPVTQANLETQLKAAQSASNGGFGFNMWASVVDRAGVVCAVARTGRFSGEQWPGSRVISAQKANTANAFSLPTYALSTANLYTATQPGGTLFGLQESNPVNVAAAYAGNFAYYGTQYDALIGQKIGGVNVFGGGLALYTAKGVLVGAIGVSGDSSCADHNIAWRTRNGLGLDYVPDGVSANHDDNIVYDASNGWRHPVCSAAAQSIAETVLPATPAVTP